jgi:hypothetical protein
LVHWSILEATNTSETRVLLQQSFSPPISVESAENPLQAESPMQAEDPPFQLRKYVELQDEIKNPSEEIMPKRQQRDNSWSNYNRATIVEKAPWFTPRKMCKNTCCVETVAISLEQEKYQVINTRDGLDLADVMIPQGKVKPHELHGPHLKYHAQTLTKAMLPCLVPGTIIGIENHKDIVFTHFFHNLRPNIKVPYMITTTGSDGDSPEQHPEYLRDPLLIKWYATNPKYHDHQEFQKNIHKFHPMKLGLSYQHPQERRLLPYLKLNNFTNPFLDKSKWDFTKNKFDFTKDVFVHFGLQHAEERLPLWDLLCPTKVTNATSCNKETNRLSPHQIYSDMSQYRFGVSPPGRGYDCYRTYEMLLLGIIPIIEDMGPESRDLFKGLPVIIMPKMTKATNKQQFVDIIHSYIESENFQNATYEEGWGHLFFQHNRQDMLKYSKRMKEIVVDDAGKQYFQAYRYSEVGNQDAIDALNGVEDIQEMIWGPWYEDPLPKFEEGEQDWLDRWSKLAEQ